MDEVLFYAVAVLGLIGEACGLYCWHKWVLADRLVKHYKKLSRQQSEAIDDLQEHCWDLEDLIYEMRKEDEKGA